jgi:MOSC domain-containing protein YiiM
MDPTAAAGIRLLSIQVGQARALQVGGRTVRTAIAKQAVAGPVAVTPLGLQGDEQVDLSVHGGLSKALYALPSEHLSWWAAQRRAAGVSMFDEAIAPGMLGENLSLQGLSEQEVWIGDVLQAGDVVLRVTEPRQPCSKFSAVMGYPQAAREMVLSGRSGFYLAVEQPGLLQAGQVLQLRPGARDTSIATALRQNARKHLR